VFCFPSISSPVSSCDFRNSASRSITRSECDARLARNGLGLSEPDVICRSGGQFGSLDVSLGPRPLFVARASLRYCEAPRRSSEKDEDESNGHERSDHGLLYELAEFDFAGLHQEVPLEYLHFSQRRQIFEIGWKEFGKDSELQVHIEPEEVEAE
jgi:hypothetical protein